MRKLHWNLCLQSVIDVLDARISSIKFIGESGHACQAIIEPCLLLLPLMTSLLFFVTYPMIT